MATSVKGLKDSSFIGSDNRLTISFSLFGLGLLIAWAWMGYCTSIVFPLSGEAGLVTDYARVIGRGCSFITLVVLTLTLKHTGGRGLRGRTIVYLSSSLGLVAILVLHFSTNMDSYTAQAILAVFGWAVFGICEGFVTYLWVKIYSVVDAKELGLYIAGGTVLGALIVYMLSYLPNIVAVGVTAILPFLSCWLSVYARSYINYVEKEAEQRKLYDRTRKLPASLMRLLASVFIFTVIYGALIEPLSTRRGIGMEATGSFMLLGPLVAGVVIIAIVWFSSRMPNLKYLYRGVMPLTIISLLVFPYVQNAQLNMAGILGSFSFQLFMTICWIIVSESARYHEMPTVHALLCNRIAYFAAFFIGSGIGKYLAFYELFRNKDLFTILCLGGVAILVIVSSILLHESELFSSGKPLKKDEGEEEAPLTLPAPEEIFQYKAERISRRYGLTPREFDVFLLLSKGRSNKLIEERLFISAHTVDSHVTHIYRKCGAHSRQEIMDLIEQEHIDIKELAAEIRRKEQEAAESGADK